MPIPCLLYNCTFIVSWNQVVKLKKFFSFKSLVLLFLHFYIHFRKRLSIQTPFPSKDPYWNYASCCIEPVDQPWETCSPNSWKWYIFPFIKYLKISSPGNILQFLFIGLVYMVKSIYDYSMILPFKI